MLQTLEIILRCFLALVMLISIEVQGVLVDYNRLRNFKYNLNKFAKVILSEGNKFK